jgi:nicotinamide riboside kinase
MQKILKIAITGSESTGKTTLAEQLANHYQTIWVSEFAREYLQDFTQTYTYQDLDNIARGQMQKEKEALALLESQNFGKNSFDNPILIVDTELLVMKVWAEDVFKKCEQWILEALLEPSYDIYFLTGIDISWSYDPLRENPHRRTYFHQIYVSELQKRNFPYIELQGTQTERLQTAIQYIDSRLMC